jgi:hypothetical protein
MAQKPLNVYVKYMSCWAYTGQYSQPPGAFGVPLDPLGLSNFGCALHCPLDNFLLGALSETDIGEYLLENKLLRAIRNKKGWTCAIRQENGSWKPWSKLDCPTAYYALQWFIRRIAISTWPESCRAQCIKPSGNIIPEDILAQVFPDSIASASIWWKAFRKCPEEKFCNSAVQIAQQQITMKMISPTPKLAKKNISAPHTSRDIHPSPPPVASAGNRPLIKISGTTANEYWGLRNSCDSKRNTWGNLSKNLRIPSLAITHQTAAHIGLGNHPVVNWLPAPGPMGGSPNAYWGHTRQFPTADAALRYLSGYFNLCACDKKTLRQLIAAGVTWIPICNVCDIETDHDNSQEIDGGSTNQPPLTPAGAPSERHMIKIKGDATAFWGLRNSCDSKRNTWGNLSKNLRIPSLAITHQTAAHIGLGSHPVVNWLPAPGPMGGSSNAYWGHTRQFPTADAALRYLSGYFNLCACDKKTLRQLIDAGVNWIPICQ